MWHPPAIDFGFFLLDNRAGKLRFLSSLVTFNCTGLEVVRGAKNYENFTRPPEADVDSLLDLGLFKMTPAAGRTLMSMADPHWLIT